MATLPSPGQKQISISEWKRFVKVADWWDRTYGFLRGVLQAAVGTDIIVLTPEDGIPARDGDTIYGAVCTIVGEEDVSDTEKTLVDSDDPILVFNIYPDAVTGAVKVPTSLTWKGTRYVNGEPC